MEIHIIVISSECIFNEISFTFNNKRDHIYELENSFTDYQTHSLGLLIKIEVNFHPNRTRLKLTPT